MLSLLPELKILIARLDNEVLYRMWKYDPKFRGLAESESVRKLFVDLFTIVETNDYGIQCWRLFGKLHRENDLPAVIRPNGTKEWYKNNLRHRDNDLPALVCFISKEWWINGCVHRDNDLPAIIYAKGMRQWYQGGKLHRDNGLPAVTWPDGDQEWYQDGKKITFPAMA